MLFVDAISMFPGERVWAFVWWLFVAVAATGLLFSGKASALWDQPWLPGMSVYPLGRAIAVDLGNTNSCVAGYVPGESETMFQACIPSWVAVSDDSTLLVGEDAQNHAAVNPEAAVTGFKRLFGKRLQMSYAGGYAHRVLEKLPYKVVEKDIRSHIEVKTNGGSVVRQVSIEHMVAKVVAKLKKTAEAYLGRKIRHAVFTLPMQYGGYAERDAVDYAAFCTGMRPMRILDEPIAAAVAYGLHRKLRDRGSVLVLHVGGGTAEASVLTFEDNVFNFLGGDFDPNFGGEDFDRRTMDYFVRLIKEKHGKDVTKDGAALGKLRAACEDAKKKLSGEELAELNIESLVDGVDLSETLTRAKFEELNNDLFLNVVPMIDKVLAYAELDKGMVDEVVLIGGSTMIPKIQQIVRDYFDGKELNTKLKPDEAVTFGAALLTHPTAKGYPCMGVNNRYQIGGASDACYI